MAYLKPWKAENGKTYRFSTLTHWAETYIAWAKDKGIVEGVSATEFDPEAPITREQMATIFGRYALKQGIELPKSDNAAGSFPDADKISEYAREFVELMRIATRPCLRRSMPPACASAR